MGYSHHAPPAGAILAMGNMGDIVQREGYIKLMAELETELADIEAIFAAKDRLGLLGTQVVLALLIAAAGTASDFLLERYYDPERDVQEVNVVGNTFLEDARNNSSSSDVESKLSHTLSNFSFFAVIGVTVALFVITIVVIIAIRYVASHKSASVSPYASTRRDRRVGSQIRRARFGSLH
jgi:hypothetical protein